jgi:hypothetical protein
LRLRISTILVGLTFIAGCDSKDKPTPQQAAQLAALKQATVKQLEFMFKRPLTDGEQECIVVELKDGKLQSYIKPPLSETLKQWHAQAQTRPTTLRADTPFDPAEALKLLQDASPKQ